MSYPVPPLLLVSALLVVVAGWDIARRRIPNWANAALGVTGLGAQALYHGGWSLLLGFAAGFITLAVLWVPWTKGRLGGGDVKAALCAATWIGTGLLFRFYLLAAIAGGLFALISFLASSAQARRDIQQNLKLMAIRAMPDAPIRSGNGRVSVPFGAAAAAAALFVLWLG